MILISHRGNINGPDPTNENQFFYITDALKKGFDVEIDVWCVSICDWWLGHDNPQYKCTASQRDFLFYNEKIWCHCKNIESLNWFNSHVQYPYKCKYFWHQTDDYTLTSNRMIWTYPGKPIPPFFNSIAVLPENVNGWDISKAAGICSDYIERYKC